MVIIPCMLVAFVSALPLGLLFAARRHIREAFRSGAD